MNNTTTYNDQRNQQWSKESLKQNGELQQDAHGVLATHSATQHQLERTTPKPETGYFSFSKALEHQVSNIVATSLPLFHLCFKPDLIPAVLIILGFRRASIFPPLDGIATGTGNSSTM
jgi:hypothetical protein